MHINFNDTLDPASLERRAYMAGDTRTAELLDRVAELEEETAEQQTLLDDLPTLEEDEARSLELEDYKLFFSLCFERLGGHYPCPSVTNNYDCQVIYDAIERGEAAREGLPADVFCVFKPVSGQEPALMAICTTEAEAHDVALKEFVPDDMVYVRSFPLDR